MKFVYINALLIVFLALASCGDKSTDNNSMALAALAVLNGGAASATTYIYSTADSSASNVYNGNLGGRSGADSKCASAKPTSLTCTNIHAFISVSDIDEIRDMVSNYGITDSAPFKTSDGTQLATSFSSFLATTYTSGNYNGKITVPASYIWTGTKTSDGSLGTDTCSGWTSSNLFDNGSANDVENNFETLPYEEGTSCAMAYPIICVCY